MCVIIIIIIIIITANEVEWTGKVEIRKKLLAVDEACMAIL